MNRYENTQGWRTAVLIWSLILLPIPALAAEPVTSPVPDAEVFRAQFTTGISEREPVDEVAILDSADASSIYYFTELMGLQGRTVSHRWEYAGRVMSEIPFEVGGQRWRVFSKKTLNPAMTGKWTVVVVDQSGWPLHAGIFEYRAME